MCSRKSPSPLGEDGRVGRQAGRGIRAPAPPRSRPGSQSRRRSSSCPFTPQNGPLTAVTVSARAPLADPSRHARRGGLDVRGDAQNAPRSLGPADRSALMVPWPTARELTRTALPLEAVDPLFGSAGVTGTLPWRYTRSPPRTSEDRRDDDAAGRRQRERGVARSASPAPIGSTSFVTKLSIVKNSRGFARASVPDDAPLAQLQDRFRHRAAEQSDASGRTTESWSASASAPRARWGEEVEVGEVKDVAPAIRDLAVATFRGRRDVVNREIVWRLKMPCRKSLQTRRRGGVAERVAQGPVDALRYRPVVDPVDLEHLVPVGDEPLLPGGGRVRSTMAGSRRPTCPSSRNAKALSSSSPRTWRRDGRAGRLDVPRHAAGAAVKRSERSSRTLKVRRLRRAARRAQWL